VTLRVGETVLVSFDPDQTPRRLRVSDPLSLETIAIVPLIERPPTAMIINASTTGRHLRFSSTVARHSRPAHAARRTKGMKYLATCAKARSYLAATSHSKTSSVDHMSD
jgi:hypothetical protein